MPEGRSLCNRTAVRCQLYFCERSRIVVLVFESVGIVIDESIIVLI
jgi:hypothetical protein